MKICVIGAGLLLAMIPAARAADCPTELKPTDDYRTLSEKIRCLNDRINELEKRYGSGGGPAAGAALAPSGRSSEGGRSVHWKDYRIEGRSCRTPVINLVCRVAFTAARKATLLVFLDDSALFDQEGMRSSLVNVSFGKKLSPFGHKARPYVRLDLPGGVASTVEFEFRVDVTRNAASGVDAISLGLHEPAPGETEIDDWPVEAVVVKGLSLAN